MILWRIQPIFLFLGAKVKCSMVGATKNTITGERVVSAWVANSKIDFESLLPSFKLHFSPPPTRSFRF